MSRVNRRDQFNKILKDLGDYYQEPTAALIELLRSKGITDAEIGRTLKISPERVARKYDKAKKK